MSRRGCSTRRRHRSSPTLIAPALTRLGVDPSVYAQRAAPLQYIWRVMKRPRQMISIAANMLRPVGGVSHVRVVYPLQAMRSDPTVLAHFATSGEIKTARRRHAAHLRAAPAGAVGRAGCRGDPRPAVRRLADRDRVRRSSRPFRHARCRGPARVPRRACGADQHAGARRDPAHAQSRGRGVPQHDPRAARRAQFPRSAGADPVLRRAEPRARLGAADAGAERGGGEGGRAAALLRGARPGLLRRAAHAAQAVHADLRLRHLHGAARTVRDLA